MEIPLLSTSFPDLRLITASLAAKSLVLQIAGQWLRESRRKIDRVGGDVGFLEAPVVILPSRSSRSAARARNRRDILDIRFTEHLGCLRCRPFGRPGGNSDVTSSQVGSSFQSARKT